MSFKPRTIRRSPAQLRAHMRAYNELAKGLRAYRKLIESELKWLKEAKRKIKGVKADMDEAEDLFKEG